MFWWVMTLTFRHWKHTDEIDELKKELEIVNKKPKSDIISELEIKIQKLVEKTELQDIRDNL